MMKKNDTYRGSRCYIAEKNATKDDERSLFSSVPNAFQNWKWEEEAKPKKAGYLKVSDIKVNGKEAAHHIEDTLLNFIYL